MIHSACKNPFSPRLPDGKFVAVVGVEHLVPFPVFTNVATGIGDTIYHI